LFTPCQTSAALLAAALLAAIRTVCFEDLIDYFTPNKKSVFSISGISTGDE
jgi:hypothetical protein